MSTADSRCRKPLYWTRPPYPWPAEGAGIPQGPRRRQERAGGLRGCSGLGLGLGFAIQRINEVAAAGAPDVRLRGRGLRRRRVREPGRGEVPPPPRAPPHRVHGVCRVEHRVAEAQGRPSRLGGGLVAPTPPEGRRSPAYLSPAPPRRPAPPRATAPPTRLPEPPRAAQQQRRHQQHQQQ